MKSDIEPTSEGLRIRAAVEPDKQEALLRELGKCASGHCSCPTPQFAKLSAIDVQATAPGVTVDLKARPGEQLDVADIQACLEHTAGQVGA